jgi:heptose I phosphotransferase
MLTFLIPALKAAWPDLFASVLNLTGTVYREQPGRRTLEFTLQGKCYFAKIHTGVGWQEIFKNLLQGRLPILSAIPEYLAIPRLQELKLDTLTLAGFACRGWNPARLQSFVITEALQDTVNLETFCKSWRNLPASLKIILIKRLAAIARCLHTNGINHRDFYLCHFLIRPALLGVPTKMPIYVIDLHRAQIRSQIPRRWQIKDLAGLYFSAMDIGLSKRDIWRFMRCYQGQTLRVILAKEIPLWQAVKQRAQQLYLKHQTVECNDQA